MINNGNNNTLSNTIRINLDYGFWSNRILDMEADKRNLISFRRGVEGIIK